jgi:futalosine hydrolase
MKTKAEICSMRILLIAATKYEIEPFIAENKALDVLITGVGIPVTMYLLQKTIQQIQPDLIIQAGIAGAFSEKQLLGEVVLVKQDAFGDIGMEQKEQFTPIFQSEFANKNEFPFSDGWLINPTTLFSRTQLRSVKAITVNKVTDSILQKQQSIINFSPEIESMEGAALHFVALHQKIPFIQMRSISNWVGERDKSKWKINEAISNLNNELKKIIDLITSESGLSK